MNKGMQTQLRMDDLESVAGGYDPYEQPFCGTAFPRPVLTLPTPVVPPPGRLF